MKDIIIENDVELNSIQILEDYIEVYNKQRKYAGDLEFSVAVLSYNIKIIVLIEGYKGYKIYNTFEDDAMNKSNIDTVFILYNLINHYDLLIENSKELDIDYQSNLSLIKELIENNINHEH